MTVQAGVTHHISLTPAGGDPVGFVIVPGSYRGPEQASDFAPRISTGTEPALREGLWDVWSMDSAEEGIDQIDFKNANKIYRSDGNVFFGVPKAIQLDSIISSSDAAVTATAPQILDFTASTTSTTMQLVGVGTKVRRLVSGSWAASTTTLAASVVWLHVHNGRAFAALGAGNNAVSGTDGDTFGTNTNTAASGFVTFNKSLYSWLGTNLRSAADPTGVVWNPDKPIGEPNTNITNLISAYGLLFIRKEDGLYTYDGAGNTIELFRHPNNLYTGNKCLVYHSDGFVYYNELARVYKMSMSSGSIANVVDITPEMVGDANKELHGHGIPIWMWSGPGNNLYVAFDDGESVYPEVLYYNGLGWQQFYRGTSGDTMRAGGFSRLTATTLFNDGATRTKAHTTLRDKPFPSYPTSGVYETSDFTGGLPFMYKAFRDVSLEVRGLSVADGRQITVAYSTDQGANWVSIGTVTTDGKMLLTFSGTYRAIGAQQMRLKFTLTRGSTSTATPVLVRWSVSFLNRPNPVYLYKVTVKLGEAQLLLPDAGAYTREPLSVANRLDFLRQAAAAVLPTTFTDMWGNAYSVYISQISVTQNYLDSQNDERLVDVTMVEAIAPARWDQFYWDAAWWN